MSSDKLIWNIKIRNRAANNPSFFTITRKALSSVSHLRHYVKCEMASRRVQEKAIIGAFSVSVKTDG